MNTFVAGLLGAMMGSAVTTVVLCYIAGRTAQRQTPPEPRKVRFGYRDAVVTPRGRIGRVGGYERFDKPGRHPIHGNHPMYRVDFADGDNPVFKWYRETELRAASPTEVDHGHALSWDAEHGCCDSVNCLRTEPHLPHGR